MTHQDPKPQTTPEYFPTQERENAPQSANASDNQQNTELLQSEASHEAAPQQQEYPQPNSSADKCLKERLYDKINVPIWVVDLVIGGCILAIIYCLIVGRNG